MSREWTVTDVKPHVMLCPLPGKLWWDIEFHMRFNSCHMNLKNGRKYASLGDSVVVLNVSDKTAEDVALELIERSYKVWQDWFRKVDSNQDGWIDKARGVASLLDDRGGKGRGGRFKFRINRSGVA